MLLRPFAAVALFFYPVAAEAVTVSRFELREGDRVLGPADLEHYLNAARCVCNVPLKVSLDLLIDSVADEVALVSGERCVTSEGRIDSSCHVIWRGLLADQGSRIEIDVGAKELIGGKCEKIEGERTLALLTDDGEGFWTEIAQKDLPVDTVAPAAPKPQEVIAGEELVEVVFTDGRKIGSTGAREPLKYQVLCQDAEGGRAFDRPPPADFITPGDVCPGTITSTAISAQFVCAESTLSPHSVTVLELVNYRTYTFDVVSIDEFGNPSRVVRVGQATPAAEEDFWERYKRSGGDANGGHCFVATATYGDRNHPQVKTLRAFRDRALMTSALGRSLVATYYRLSPQLAAAIADRNWAKNAAQIALDPLVRLAADYLEEDETP